MNTADLSYAPGMAGNRITSYNVCYTKLLRTVEEALDMATGLNGTEHDEEEQNSRTDPDQIWYRWAATDAVGIVADVRGRGESWVDVLKSMKRKTPGHVKFEYNSINTFVVNRIAERVADKPLYEQFT